MAMLPYIISRLVRHPKLALGNVSVRYISSLKDTWLESEYTRIGSF